tara:strand:- start:518 stop:1666 length:1149 start_codon:yes stop_codon:yes gene_type:complete
MKILLVGEYSNLHNSLKQGLQALGCEVTLLATGDAFKRFPADINVRGKFCQDNKFLNYCRQAIFKVTKIDIALIETALRSWLALRKMQQFDVIQLINEYPLDTPYFLEKKLIRKLRNLTKRLVVLGCGDDYVFMSNLDKIPYHPSRIHKDIGFAYSERNLTKKHRRLHDVVFELKDMIITSDLDYHTVYQGRSDYFGMIANPVNTDRLQKQELPPLEKIVIFHGINAVNYHKKGNDFFEKALEKIATEYADKVIIATVKDLPYLEYIKKYEEAHIVLDQVYALDQGYNALEAMAQGKVVFTGAGEAFCAHYILEPDSVAIHVIPDADFIYNKLKNLIEDQERIVEISNNARKFIEEHHNYKDVAQTYLNAWLTINQQKFKDF